MKQFFGCTFGTGLQDPAVSNRGVQRRGKWMEEVRSLQLVITSGIVSRSWSTVIKAATKLRRLEPGNLIGLEGLAQGYWYKGEYRRALSVVRRLIAENPHESGYFTLESACHERLGQYLRAEASLKRAYEMSMPALEREAIGRRLEALSTITCDFPHASDPLTSDIASAFPVVSPESNSRLS